MDSNKGLPKLNNHQPINLAETIENLICSIDPLKYYLQVLNDIFINQHCYINQFNNISIQAETLVKLADIMRRYEANGLQLEGKILWIFSVLLPIYTITNETTDPILNGKLPILIETLLRILFEQKIYYNCIEIMQFLIDHYNTTISQIFEIGISIADQLPTTIPNNNFIAFLHFGLRNVISSKDSIEIKTQYIYQLTSFISIIHRAIEQNYIANYFLGYIVRILNNINIQNNKLFTIEMLNLFCILIPLHPDHSKYLYESNFPSTIIELLLNENNLYIKSKYLNFLSVLCIDTNIKNELQQLLPLSLFNINNISYDDDNNYLKIIESIFLSFIKIYNNKIEYFHNKEDQSNESEQYFIILEKFLVYGIKRILESDQLNPFDNNNNIENNSIILDNNNNMDINNNNNNNNNNIESAFDFLNLMIKTLSRIIDIRLISEEVNQQLIYFLEYIYKFNDDFTLFRLDFLDLVDSILSISYRHLDFCWYLCINDVKDIALLILARVMNSFFNNCNKAGLLNSHEIHAIDYFIELNNNNNNNNNNNQSYSRPNSRKIISDNIVSQVLKMQYLTISYLDLNRHIVDEWNIEDCNDEPIEFVCRKVLLSYLTIEVFGMRENRFSIISENSLFNSTQMTEVILELLKDERLGMSEYPKMKQKCIQLLGSIINFNDKPIDNSIIIYEYIISIILSREHTENEIDLLYSSLSCLLTLSAKDRNIRRKIVTILTEICNSISSLDCVNYIRPLLNLFEEISEFSSRFEYSHEECVFYIIISALKSHSDLLLLQGLKVMYLLGINSQGFVNRAYCRPEIEDIIINILWNNNNCKIILSALKILNLITKDVNMKPYWIPSQHTYNFKKYSNKLENRKLYQTSIIDLLINIKNNISIRYDYRLIIYCYSLSIASNLICACSDGLITISCINDQIIVDSLKNKIILNIIPWIPYSLEFYSILKNKKKLVSLQGSIIDDDNFDNNNKNFVDKTLLHCTIDKICTVSKDNHKEMSYFLISKVVISIHSFFCLEGKNSLQKYINNIKLFQRNPIIPSLSFIMLENINNLEIQQRGINIIKFFVENKVDLTSVGMHSTSLLILAANTYITNINITISFCNIIISLARSDDFIRDNLIRFNVASSLCKIMFVQESESCRLACISIIELISNNESNIILLCQNSLIVESILAVLDSLECDLRVQIEGLKALIIIDKVPEFLFKHKKLKTINILKKSKKFLITILKQEKYNSEAEKQEIEDLLLSPLCSNDYCCIS